MTCEPVFKEAEALLNIFKNMLVFGYMAQYTLLKDEVASLQVVILLIPWSCIIAN